ncbi:putative secreted protein (Por secretion system target) [Christiangramia gaetbulicola]|uniref:Putative secreted protein (Por secretion system target) n=1 Tax=Christiangramia gaetbulicola TaxID=703340 RepID=A0A2T6ADK9_9FLAO|nr:T9SS type A sorting domain-containing protein [Christiangramia gaetbulicola]PTX41915.1 putative secreted protein (Por secretion system target) [Christiangramia gaetbulicola]
MKKVTLSSRTRSLGISRWFGLIALSFFIFFSFESQGQILPGFTDGNCFSNSPDPATSVTNRDGKLDWEDVYNGNIFNTYPNSISTGIRFDDGTTEPDRSFIGGSTKDHIDIPSWQNQAGTSSDKSDIGQGGAILINGVIYFFGNRLSSEGTTNIGFWLFQQDVQSLIGSFSGAHEVGDVLVVVEVTQGGAIGTVNAYRWVGTGNGDIPQSTKSLVQINTDNSTLNAYLNTNNEPTPWPHQVKNDPLTNNMPPVTFFEGFIDIATLNLAKTCFSSFLIETRSSNVVTSILEDYIGGGFNVEPKVTIEDITDCENEFPKDLVASVDGGIPPLTFEWKKDGVVIPMETSSSISVSEAGTYSVIVTGSGIAGGTCTSESDSAEITIDPSPTPADPMIVICIDETSTDLNDYDSTVLDGETGTVAWYDGDPDSGGTLIDPDNAVNLNNITDLFAKVTLTETGCEASVDVTVTINPLPTPADPMIVICIDETSTDLNDYDSTVLDGETGTVAWYDGDPDSGGTLIDPDNAVNLNNITDLFAKVTLTETSCEASVDVTVTINPLPTPADPMIVICIDETSTDLNDYDSTVLDGETGTVAWYDGDPDSGGTLIDPDNAVNLNNITDLVAKVALTETSCEASVDVTVTINPLPTPADPMIVICIDETSTDLNDYDSTVLDGETGTVAWYDGDPDSGGTLIDPDNAVNLNNVTDLFAKVTLTGTGCSASVDVTVTINPLPTPADPMIVICIDETSTDLNDYDSIVLDGETGTVAWYDGDPDSGGTLIDPDNAVNLNNITDLFAKVTLTGTGCSASVDVTVTINPLPTPADPMIVICIDETSTDLNDYDSTVLDSESGAVAWYDGDPDSGGTLIDPDNAVNLNNITDLFAKVTLTETGCIASVDVTVTINPDAEPADPMIVICIDETSTDLNDYDTTVLDGALGTVTWYDGDPDSGGSLIDPDNAVNLNNVSDLFAKVTLGDTGCEGTVDVTVTINPLPTPADPMIVICIDETSTDLNDYDSTVLDGETGTVAWYDGDPDSGGSLIDPDNAVNLNNITDLFAKVTLTETGCDTSVDVTVTINPLPTPADAMILICIDETSTDLNDYDSTVLDGEMGTVAWYDGDPDSGGTLIDPDNAVNLNNITDLFAKVTLTGTGCSASVDVTVTINPLPTPADPMIVICIDETSTDLNDYDSTVLDGEMGTVAWYDGDPDSGGSLIDPDNAVNLKNITDLFAEVTLTDTGCIASVDVTVTINPEAEPADPMIVICTDETSTDLNDYDNTVLDGALGTVTWYDGDPESGGTLIDPDNAVNLNNVSDLFAKVTLGDTGCEGTVDVTVTINPLPTPADPMIEICIDETSTDLNDYESTVLDGETGTVAWYDGDPDSGGSLIDPDNAVNLNNVTDLYAKVTLTETGCAASVDVTVKINPLPTFETEEPQLTCFGEAPSIAVTSDTSGLEFRLVIKGQSGTFADYAGPFTDLEYDTDYVLTARDKTTGCEKDYEFTTPIPLDIPSNVTLMVNDPTCDTYNGSTYFGSIQITNHVPGYSYAVILQSEFTTIKAVPASSYMNYDASNGLITGVAVGQYYVISKSPDGCLSAIAPAVLIEPNCITCETAFAKDASSSNCFDQYPDLIPNDNRWGWTNYYSTVGNYSLDLYAGAGQCDISKGALVGEVNIIDNGDGTIDVQFVADPGYIMSSVHLYVGCEPLPYKQKGKNYDYTVAPGQYPQNPQGNIGYVTDYTIENISVSGDFYLIAHTDICTSENADLISEIRSESSPLVYTPKKRFSAKQSCISSNGPRNKSTNISSETQSKVDSSEPMFSVAPVPFKDVLNIGYLFDYTSDVTVQIFDLNGRLLSTYYDKAVNSSSISKFNVDFRTKPNQVYVVRMITDRAVYTAKVIADK